MYVAQPEQKNVARRAQIFFAVYDLCAGAVKDTYKLEKIVVVRRVGEFSAKSQLKYISRFGKRFKVRDVIGKVFRKAHLRKYTLSRFDNYVNV